LLPHSHAFAARPAVAPYHLGAVPVIANRFDGAAFHRFFTKPFLIGGLWLFINVGVATVIIPFEIGGGSLSAQVAVNALIIDVEFAGYVLGIFVCGVGHVSLKVK
jgi:hypothetical protein